VISNRFRGQDATLAVVGVGQSIVECDDFYCALAKNTGMNKLIIPILFIQAYLFWSQVEHTFRWSMLKVFFRMLLNWLLIKKSNFIEYLII
jgi:hypothetical protein